MVVIVVVSDVVGSGGIRVCCRCSLTYSADWLKNKRWSH